MVSDTQKTWRRRDAKTANLGKAKKKARAKAGTPKFPIHPTESKAAAKPAAAKPAAAKPAAAKP